MCATDGVILDGGAIVGEGLYGYFITQEEIAQGPRGWKTLRMATV